MIREMTLQEYSDYLHAGNAKVSVCPLKKTMDIIGGKWATDVLYHLVLHPSARFGQLKRSIPEVTNTMLTSTLRELEDRDIITRIQYNEIPPRVEYSLTEYGHALLPVLFEAAKWCERYDELHNNLSF